MDLNFPDSVMRTKHGKNEFTTYGRSPDHTSMVQSLRAKRHPYPADRSCFKLLSLYFLFLTTPPYCQFMKALVFLVVISTLLFACGAQNSTILIGRLFSASGAFQSESGVLTKGWKMWEEDVRARGGLTLKDGSVRQIRVVDVNDASDPQVAGLQTAYLIDTEQVHFVIGPFGAAMAQVCDRPLDDATLLKKFQGCGGQKQPHTNPHHLRRRLEHCAFHKRLSTRVLNSSPSWQASVRMHFLI